MAEESKNEGGMTPEASNVTKVPYHELFSFADAADCSLMVIGAITAVGSGLCLPLMTLIFGELADSFGHNAEAKSVAQEVAKISLKYVYLALGAAFATFSHVSCWMITGERQAARIRSLYLRAVLRQDVGYFDTEAKTGEIIERISSDSVIIQDAMSEKVGKFIQLSSSFFGGIVIAFIKGWLLASILLSAIPLLVVSAAFMTVLITKLTARSQTSYSEAAVVAEETITSIRDVASFTGEKRALDRYEKSLHGAYKAGVEIGLAAGVGSGVFMLILFCSYALAIWFGGVMIIEKGYTGGDVVNVTMAILLGSLSFGLVSPCLSSFAAGRVSAAKLFRTIHRKPEIDTHNPNGLTLRDIKGDLELRNVDFSYPSRPSERVLTGFSLTLPRGATLALVGESGSGKSTVINLVERFYDPQSGEVLIDGINIKEFQLKWLRGKIGLVSQEPVLFASTIKENITYGTKGATLEEITLAAEVANAASFIDKLPRGLETDVGAKGSQLSGGQKQRIALARAVLKNPRILLLDEATSALDAESEKLVKEALDRAFIGQTMLVVAHRLSTVKNADSIAVIQQGKIVEKGTHLELMQSDEGVYKHLIQLQEAFKGPSSSSTTECSINNDSVSTPSLLEKYETPPPSPPSKRKDKVALRRLAYLNKPELPQLILGSLAAAMNGAVLPIFGLVYSGAIKALYEPPHELRKQSEFWASMFIALGAASLLATPLKTYSFAVAGSELIRRVRLMCFHKVVHMEIGYFDSPQNSRAAVASRLSADATSLRSLVGDTAAVLLQNISTVVSGLIIGFGASWELTLIVLPMLPLIGLNGYLHMKFVGGFAKDTKKLYEDASEVASEAVSSVRTVASFCGEDEVVELYREKCEVPVRLGTKHGLISGASFGLSLFFLYSVYAASYYAGARLVDAGKIGFGDVFRVFLGLSMTATAISQSGALAPDSSKAQAGAASVFALLDSKVEIDSSSNSGRRLENIKGDIIFKHVSFRYPSRPSAQVLEDFCLTIRSAKTVAIVGESGSGKSTVISLVQRFYDPNAGVVTVDDVGIRDLNLKWWRRQMGMVSQEPLLFNDTIRANIAYGKGEGEATEAEIVAAANLSNAHTFISAMDKGYETIVGEGGIQLSGGQKQRVAIARAILKSPQILLLDEATSALDAESEKVVQDALNRVMMGRTTLVVAHRLSTIKYADQIVVLKDGAIVENGKHEILINKKDGIYASLVTLHAHGQYS